MEYAQSQNNQTAPTTGWDDDIPTWREGYYIWQRTVTKMSGVPLSQDSYGEPVCLTGSTGSSGAPGQSVDSIVTSYCNYGTGTPAATYSGWQSAVPAYDSTKPNYWIKTVITYSNPTTTDTKIYKDNGITSATSTAAAANTTAQNAKDKADDAWDKADNAETIAGNANTAISDLNQYFWRKKSASTNVPAGSYVTNIPGTTYSVKTCVKVCPQDKPYLNTDNNACVNSCPYYIENNICVSDCTDDKFSVGLILPNDLVTKKECKDDCPYQYPYYVKEDGINYYLCYNECPIGLRFHQNENPAKIGKECISTDDCPDNTNYKFLSDDEKECLRQCPSGKYYVNEKGQKCYDQCPEANPYHYRNDYECYDLEHCPSPNKYIDYKNNYCVESCSGFKYTYEKKDPGNVNNVLYTVCLNDCGLMSKYLTPDNKCIDECLDTAFLERDTTVNYKCKCKYKYYSDLSQPIIVCLPEIEECSQTAQHKIQKINTNECLNKCPTILSLNGDLCYTEESQCEPNTKVITLSNGQNQCDCLYKFYKEGNTKTCLASAEQCPGGKELYIPSTKECISSCPSGLDKIFQNYCLDQCPKGASIPSGGTECQCPNDKINWYSISETNFECLPGKCLESHPFLISDSKQCVERCKGTSYDHLVNNICYANCDGFANTESTPIDTYANDYEYATNSCRCKTFWYFEETTQKNVCPTEDKNSCKDFTGKGFNYVVKSTRQCVVSCPSDYSYSFNDECFYSCDNAKTQFNYDVKINPDNEESKVCICNDLWKYETEGDTKKIICLQQSECDENFLEIFDTRECFEIEEGKPVTCPRESPLELNWICYKENNCPINSHYDPDKAGKCVCDNLWYLTENNKIHCMPNDTLICPDDYPYQIYKTKECIKPVESTANKCPTEHPYFFNYICYEKNCPELTKEDTNKFCLCDETKGKWYKYNNINPDSDKKYLYCGLEECPTINPNKQNLLEEKKQCTYNCDEDGEDEFIWAFRNLCYKECPEFTKEDPIQRRCIFYELDESSDIKELRDYVSVQVKELYEKGPKGGFLYNNYDASLQIYPYNKLGTLVDKSLIMKSNLSYIDLDTCLSRIFEDQGLENNDQIFIVKYDLLNSKKEEESSNENTPTDLTEEKDIKNSDNYLINEVEYEFYSSKTLKRIEASTCEPKEIIISYPISYNMHKFDNPKIGINDNDLKLKFEIGKELYHENKDIDTFNFNSSVYKELCTPLVVKGKDLVYESRYDYLYPNNITLCESNCTFYYTDYELGRINCKCDYKEILDFDREMPAESDLLHSPNFVHPSQSGANAQIIKCLNKLINKDNLKQNEAFYYCLVVSIAEVASAVMAGILSVQVVKESIYKLGRKNISNKSNKNNKVDIYNNDNVITSKRLLNNNSNPPKKNDVVNEEENLEEKEKEKEKPNRSIINKKITLNNMRRFEDDDINEEENNKTEDDYGNNNSKYINNYYKEIKDLKGKAEFIPIDYNFKFFKPSDNGIQKQIKRSEIPFKEVKFLSR